MTEDLRPLHERFRPTSLSQVIGQDHVVKSLAAQIAAPDRPHSYMFTGPAGNGKTSMARILAKGIGATDFGIININAPNEGNIDNIRAEVANSMAMSLGSDYKVIIIDEIHSLSKQAWSALLEPTEEPPSHCYWIFCSTEDPKVPIPNKSRLIHYKLNEVDQKVLKPYIGAVAATAGIPLVDGMLDVVTEAARGSVRQALVYLQAVRGIDTLSDARRIIYNVQLEEATGTKSATERLGDLLIDKCRDWGKFRNLLYSVVKEDPTSVRPSLMLQFSRKMQDAQSLEEAWHFLLLLDAAKSLPENPLAYENLGNLQLMIGKILINTKGN